MRAQTIDRTDDRHLDQVVTAMSDRALRLRNGAATVHPLLATAYRRRAAELELASWAVTVRSGRSPADVPPELAVA